MMLNLPIKILERQKLAAAAASVTFSSVATKKDAWDAVAGVTSRHLVVIINAAGSEAANEVDVELQFNGDGGANYNDQYLMGADNVGSAAVAAGQTSMTIGKIPAASVANAFGGGEIVVPHAFNTTNHKALVALTGSAEYSVVSVAGRWAATAAITSIGLTPSAGNFVANSIFILGVVDERYLVEEEFLAADGVPTFDDIPQIEGDLAVVAYVRSDEAAQDLDEIIHDINDDATDAHYAQQEMTGNAAATGGAQAADREIGVLPAEGATANVFGAFLANYSQFMNINLPHYLSLSGFHEATGPVAEVRAMSGRRDDIEQIFKLEYAPSGGTDFKAGSLFSLYLVPKRLIDRQELTADTASITFDNIPDDFEALELNIYARSDEADLEDEASITINDDAVAANYDLQEINAAIGVVTAARNAASQQLVYIPAATEGANEFGGGCILIPAYAEGDGHKHLTAVHGRTWDKVAISSHRWESTSAITKIVLAPVGGTNFKAGSVFELEGILSKVGLPAEVGMRFGV